MPSWSSSRPTPIRRYPARTLNAIAPIALCRQAQSARSSRTARTNRHGMNLQVLNLANLYYDELEEHRRMHESCRTSPCPEARALQALAVGKAKQAWEGEGRGGATSAGAD